MIVSSKFLKGRDFIFKMISLILQRHFTQHVRKIPLQKKPEYVDNVIRRRKKELPRAHGHASVTQSSGETGNGNRNPIESK